MLFAGNVKKIKGATHTKTVELTPCVNEPNTKFLWTNLWIRHWITGTKIVYHPDPAGLPGTRWIPPWPGTCCYYRSSSSPRLLPHLLRGASWDACAGCPGTWMPLRTRDMWRVCAWQNEQPCWPCSGCPCSPENTCINRFNIFLKLFFQFLIKIF